MQLLQVVLGSLVRLLRLCRLLSEDSAAQSSEALRLWSGWICPLSTIWWAVRGGRATSGDFYAEACGAPCWLLSPRAEFPICPVFNFIFCSGASIGSRFSFPFPLTSSPAALALRFLFVFFPAVFPFSTFSSLNETGKKEFDGTPELKIVGGPR